MTYGSFLLLFLVPPTALLVVLQLARHGWRPRTLILPPILALIALVYTSLWDNYLVANRIWWYDPERISGLLLWFVPIEEYLFFILQPLMTGFWTLQLASRPTFASATLKVARAPRGRALATLAVLWLASAAVLMLGWSPGRYLGLILIWALPPIALQFAYGFTVLWRNWRTTLLAIVPPTLYLAAADSLAIAVGVWTINPATSTGLLLGGILPLEEFLFFLVTNCLVAFAVLLISIRTDRA